MYKRQEFDYAPQDYADAMDAYDKILEITGEITGETIAPNAEGVDEEGPHCGNGRLAQLVVTRVVGLVLRFFVVGSRIPQIGRAHV